MGKDCDDQEFTSLLQDLMLPTVRLYHGHSRSNRLIENVPSNKPIIPMLSEEICSKFSSYFNEKAEEILFKEDVNSLTLQKVQLALKEMDKTLV